MAECIISGRQGPKGDTGPQGLTGSQGPQGPSGKAYSFQMLTGISKMSLPPRSFIIKVYAKARGYAGLEDWNIIANNNSTTYQTSVGQYESDSFWVAGPYYF